MELTLLLNAGGLAGLAVGAVNGLLLPFLARWCGVTSEQWRPFTAQSHALLLLLHLVTGIGLGLLFWLSWGLTAIVSVAWWQRGLAFAVIVWATTCLPFSLGVLATQRWHWRAALLALLEWLYVLCAVGLACAWSWAKSV